MGGTQRRVGWVEGQGQGDDGAGVVSAQGVHTQTHAHTHMHARPASHMHGGVVAGQGHQASADRVTAHAVAGGVKVRSGGVSGPSEAGAGVGGGGLAEDEYGLPAPVMESDDEEDDVVQGVLQRRQLQLAADTVCTLACGCECGCGCVFVCVGVGVGV